MKLNKNVIAFTGGGTGGHIYPGLAIASDLRTVYLNNNKNIKIIWIGCSKGMDRNIVEKSMYNDTIPSADKFYGIPSGKLRRYFSMKNFTDVFKIFAGFIKAYFILLKQKPAVLFSKGGFVSVPPVIAAKLLKIPVFTHECDFTLGLANRINFKFATNMFVSYEETKQHLSKADQERVIVTGNPVRPVFYTADKQKGYDFLGLKGISKPVLLVLGGSSGAKQINELVYKNLDYLCSKFVVVHQTGLVNGDAKSEAALKEKYRGNYLPYSFIYSQMPDVAASADVILSRAGANSIWEAAVLYKPMVLIPLCGSGTRGDQVDNARFFSEKGAAEVLIGEDVNDENLKSSLEKMLDEGFRGEQSEALKKLTLGNVPSKVIADILYKTAKEQK